MCKICTQKLFPKSLLHPNLPLSHLSPLSFLSLSSPLPSHLSLSLSLPLFFFLFPHLSIIQINLSIASLCCITLKHKIIISLFLYSGLVMIQTTIGVFNPTVYNLSTSQALLAWHRVRLANWLATSGEEWAAIFSPHNSGML